MTLTVDELMRLDGQRKVVYHGGKVYARCACGELLSAFDNGTSIRWCVSRHNRGQRHLAWRSQGGGISDDDVWGGS